MCGTAGGRDPSPISLHGGGGRLSASREALSSQALRLPPRRSRARLGGRSCSRGAHLRAPEQIFKTLPCCPLQLLPVSYSCSQHGFWQGSSAVAVSTACTPSPFPLVGPHLSRAPTPPVPGPAWSVSAVPAPPSGCTPSAPGPLSPPSHGTFLLSLIGGSPSPPPPDSETGGQGFRPRAPLFRWYLFAADLRQLDALCARHSRLGRQPPRLCSTRHIQRS